MLGDGSDFRGQKRCNDTLGADKDYNTHDFVAALNANSAKIYAPCSPRLTECR
jgi:hypothetical protein